MKQWEDVARHKLDSSESRPEKHPPPTSGSVQPHRSAYFSMLTPVRRPIVLLAEDSEDDAFFFRWTLKKAGLDCELHHAADGAEAIRMLEATAGPGGRRGPRSPDLVFLDLKMPTLTGFEVLAWIRDHPFDPPLDIAVLSGSEHASDVQRAKDLGASSYYVKPLTADQLRARFAAWHEQQTGATTTDPAFVTPSRR